MAANLAYVLARNLGKPTLLIDVDLKSPTVHDCMGTRNFPGLRDVFEGGRSVDSCLHRAGNYRCGYFRQAWTPVGCSNYPIFINLQNC